MSTVPMKQLQIFYPADEIMPDTAQHSLPVRPHPLPVQMVSDLVTHALAEDWGRLGDITSAAVIDDTAQAQAIIRAREDGVLAGLAFAQTAFEKSDTALQIKTHLTDGHALLAGTEVMTITGPAKPILAAERVALNFLGHMSGIASQTAELCAMVAHTPARICDTRKTTPGLRSVEKYAVRAGGGVNHRFGLDDAILIKDNHIAVAGGVTTAIARAQAHVGHMMRIEVEVDTLDQLNEALAAGAEILLLDNMNPDQLRDAVTRIDGRAISEASGRVNASTVVAIAEAGVDYISVGRITHSAPCLDLGLDIDFA